MPVLIYSLFGSSRELAVGPVAVTSLLISSSLRDVIPGADEITNPNSPPPDLVRARCDLLRLPAPAACLRARRVSCVCGANCRVVCSCLRALCSCLFVPHSRVLVQVHT